MKYIVILGDGMADMPSDALGGMTPLEVAYKPNIDSMAQKAICGMCKTVPDGIKPGSDVANLSVMGYSPLKYYSGRSPLEALSIGVDMADSDLAVRCNLVTLSEEENYADKSMLDYSAGEISTEEAAELISFVQEALGDDEFAFYSGVSYRHCLIKHNGERGTEYTPPHDISGKVIGDYLPKGLYGDKMLDLMVKSYDILKDHPINLKRIADGKNPANSIWLWGEGSKPTLPNFESLRGLKGAVISAVDLLKGIGIASGMEIIEVEGATGTVHTNFAGKAQACVQAIRDGFDYVYLHMEAPDECGHQGDSKGKVKSIELIDEKVVAYILSELEDEDLRILVCPDHPTPLVTKTHSSEPIPFIIYDSTCIKQGVSAYTESECAKTGIMLNSGDELVDLFLQKEEDMQEKDNIDAVIDEQNDLEEQEINESVAEVDNVNDQVVDEESDIPVDKQNSNDEVKDANSDIVIVDDSNAENTAKIDPNGQNSEGDEQNADKNGKKKGGDKKGKFSPKKKKLITILIAVAVLAVVILVSVLTPILVINAPKVLISSAEDFTKPIKDKKELYYLEKDITVDGDLTLGLNVDLNKKTLTVNGNLTLENPKGGAMTLGVKSGKEFTLGGKITVNGKLLIKNANTITILTNVSANDIEFDSIAQGNSIGSIQANNSFNIRSSKVVFDQLAFGENISSINAVNSDITFNKATKIDINLQNARVRANSDIGNAVLDEQSELRLVGFTYNNFNSGELGTISGGKLVYVSENGGFGKIIGVNTVWVSKESLKDNNALIINVQNEKYIDWLETPQFAVIERVGDKATLELSSIDSLATKVLVTIDNAETPLEFAIDRDSDGIPNYVFDLGTVLNTVGNHSIKIVLRSDEPEFIRDSDPYFTQHTHYITLDKVGTPKVEKNNNNEYVLTFKAVHFAETYEIVFDGIVMTIKNDNVKAGEEISFNLSGEAKFASLLTTPGNHSIIIVAKSSVEGINSSAKAYAKFDPINVDLAAPSLEIKMDGDNYVFSWNKVDNALRYKLVFTGADKSDYEISTGVTELVISKADLDGYTNVKLIAIGGKYYNDSETAEISLA